MVICIPSLIIKMMSMQNVEVQPEGRGGSALDRKCNGEGQGQAKAKCL
jgi:hypothetical protein